MNEAAYRLPLGLLVVIVDKEKSRRVVKCFQNAHVHLLYQCIAEGTASSEILDMLGLGATDKTVTFSLAPRAVTERLLPALSEEFRLKSRGKGIAFTLPVNSAVSSVAKMLSEEAREKIMQHLSRMEEGMESMKCEATHSLIVTVINRGYSEELMEAARSAGATGGTVLHARRMGLEESMKFLGISLQTEKEIVVIIAPVDKKVEMMKAIGHRCGVHSEAQGILFSIPVDSVAGLG